MFPSHDRGAGIGVANSIIGGIGQKKRERRAIQNQMKLMREQTRLQEGLSKYGSDLQYEQWLRTNYPAQVEQLKKAGLSEGLIYGGGGGQGGTTGSQTGGAASGGNAPAPQPILLGMIKEMMQTVAGLFCSRVLL